MIIIHHQQLYSWGKHSRHDRISWRFDRYILVNGKNGTNEKIGKNILMNEGKTILLLLPVLKDK